MATSALPAFADNPALFPQRETVENFRPAAEEAAVRDEEAAQFSRFGGNGPGFISV